MVVIISSPVIAKFGCALSMAVVHALTSKMSIKELSPTELCLAHYGLVEAWENVIKDVRVGGIHSC